MAQLTLEIITPSRSIYNGPIKSVVIPGTKGSFQVLVNHAPLISTFETGVIRVDPMDEKSLYFTTAGGTAEVLDNKVLILADSLEAVETIDEERARLAKERAEGRLAEKAETTDMDRAKRALERADNRLKAIDKYIRGIAPKPL